MVHVHRGLGRNRWGCRMSASLQSFLDGTEHGIDTSDEGVSALSPQHRIRYCSAHSTPRVQLFPPHSQSRPQDQNIHQTGRSVTLNEATRSPPLCTHPNPAEQVMAEQTPTCASGAQAFAYIIE